MGLRFRKLITALKQNKKSIPLVVGVVLLGLLQAVQMFYPGDRMTPGAKIDGMPVAGMKKEEVVSGLDKLYANQKINVRLGDSEESALEPTFADIGVVASNEARVDDLTYPFYLRIVPTSLFWVSTTLDYGEPEINKDSATLEDYLSSGVRGACSVNPRNASLEAEGDKLKLVPSAPGFRCEDSDLRAALASVEPDPSKKSVVVNVEAERLEPKVTDGTANDLARHLEQNTDGGVDIKVGDTTANIPQKDVLSWLRFEPLDAGTLKVSIVRDRAEGLMRDTIAPRVRVDAGVTKLTTHDFVVTDRKNGRKGRSLNVAVTLDRILKVVTGDATTVTAATVATPARIEYERTFSRVDSELNSVLSRFVRNNEGTFGISMIELSGERRRAEYEADRRFVAASTYKLPVAYSTLLRVESGLYSWSDDVVGGRNLSDCFYAMIAESDNACPEALLDRIGFNEITDDLNRLGMRRTTFLQGNRPLVTAGDLAIFLATLESNQMFEPSSRTRLINALNGNIFRRGIPAGASAGVANKVGFLDGFLHDAAIVDGPNGKYVLVILSEGSSWQAIADLTREIEKFRSS